MVFGRILNNCEKKKNLRSYIPMTPGALMIGMRSDKRHILGREEAPLALLDPTKADGSNMSVENIRKTGARVATSLASHECSSPELRTTSFGQAPAKEVTSLLWA